MRAYLDDVAVRWAAEHESLTGGLPYQPEDLSASGRLAMRDVPRLIDECRRLLAERTSTKDSRVLTDALVAETLAKFDPASRPTGGAR